jgi:hypothetical protein
MPVKFQPIFGNPPDNINEKLAFVLMPFTDDELNDIYDSIVKPTVESKGLECARASDYQTHHEIMKDVWHGICQARVVIAEMTSFKANVMYELSISHTIGKPTKDGKFPFDISHIRVIYYTNNAAGVKLSECNFYKNWTMY